MTKGAADKQRYDLLDSSREMLEAAILNEWDDDTFTIYMYDAMYQFIQYIALSENVSVGSLKSYAQELVDT